MSRTVHIIGAGLAGLSAAVRLSKGGEKVIVHEGAHQAGGRTRSYHDTATGLTIDNGTHLLLSGNHAARDLLRTIGSEDEFQGPGRAEFQFADLASEERWTININDGRIPWWVFDRSRRVPGTKLSDYPAMAAPLWAADGKTIGEVLPCEGPLYERLVHPLLLAALNIEPEEGSAKLAGAIIRETLAAGGRACHPLVARDGLSAAFIDPAIAYLKARGGEVRIGDELRAMTMEDGRVSALEFGSGSRPLPKDDVIVLAVPPHIARMLVPGLQTPTTYRAIVNAHYRIEVPHSVPRILGLVNATADWIFAFEDRITVTVSAADHLVKEQRETLARNLWAEVAAATGLGEDLPPWQIVRERRATFAATPAENAKRPPTRTAWTNLALAGDWTDTGLPGTMEGAVRSGYSAAHWVTQMRAMSP